MPIQKILKTFTNMCNYFRFFRKKRRARASRPPLLCIGDPAYTYIPYQELWRSATRCKLVHYNNTRIHQMWRMANAGHSDTGQDIAYTKELNGVSEPTFIASGQSTRDANTLSSSISALLWSKGDTIYMTFRVDTYLERAFLKKQSKLRTMFGKVAVNRYMYKQFISILNPLLGYLEGYKNGNYELVISGYSLGAVVTHIASAVFAHMFPNMYVKCHTFGSPKPGNDAFCRWFSERVKENYRVIISSDPIVHLPMGCKWTHAANVTLCFDKRLHISVYCNNIPWYKRIVEERKIVKEALASSEIHHFDTYISQLWNYIRITDYIETIGGAENGALTPL